MQCTGFSDTCFSLVLVMKFCCTPSEEGNIRITEKSSSFKIFVSFLHFFFLFPFFIDQCLAFNFILSGSSYMYIFIQCRQNMVFYFNSHALSHRKITTNSVEIAFINRMTNVRSSYLKLVTVQDFFIFHFLGFLSGNIVICRDAKICSQ